MTVALRWPGHVSQLVAVDNAPLDAAIASKFAQYIRGMKKVEAAQVTRQADADNILKDYEEVVSCMKPPRSSTLLTSFVVSVHPSISSW